MTEHEQIENAVAAQILGSAEPAESDMVRAHLEGCASCRQLAQRLTRAVSALPLANDEVAPPARLRERILAAAAASPRSAAAPARVIPIGAARWRRPSLSPLAAAAAAAAVAVLVGTGLGVGLGHSLQAPAAPVAQVGHYQLTGHGQMLGARASVVALNSDGITLIDFKSLPALPTGRVYELWLIGPGAKPVPGGVFAPDQDGSKVLVLSRGLNEVKTLAVTVEAGPYGATAPSQQPELAGSV